MAELAVVVRVEESRDSEGVRTVNEQAFGRPNEASLVDALRGLPQSISLVASARERIVGHILFTPLQIEGSPKEVVASGLGPMAVLPECQRQGVGSQLVRAGLDSCRASRHDAVVVIGHPEFYSRFGFVPAVTKGLRCEFDVPSEVFMVLELRTGALDSSGGFVKYRPEFSAFE
jgi:putative acetyltransferase